MFFKRVVFRIYTLFLVYICTIMSVYNIYAEKCGTFGNHVDMNARKGERALAPDLPFSMISSKGHFKIHYALQGIYAVSPLDKDNNLIPDYVDECAKAFEFAYSKQVEYMGFPPPPNNGENGKNPYDVYIVEFANQGYYGLTTSELALPGSTNTHAYSLTYIEVDNNYAETDRTSVGNSSFNTFGLDALKITAAHEFQHAIHLANFGINKEQYDVSLYEMFCTWIEFFHYPDIKDYHYYVKNYFLQPKDNRFGQRYVNNVSSGYANALFFEYLHDISQGKNLGFKPVLDMWDYIGKHHLGYRALELALQDNGIPLHDIWCGFVQRAYYTGSRSFDIDSSMKFQDARLFPTLKSEIAFVNPRAVFTGYVFPYELRGLSASIKNNSELLDTANLIVSPAFADFYSVFGGQDKAYAVVVDKNSNNMPIGYDYFADINLYSVPFCSKIHYAEGQIHLSADRVYPNPLILDKHTDLCLPLPLNVKSGDEVEVKIFTVGGLPVHAFKTKAEVDYQNRSRTPLQVLIAKLTNIQLLEPAVYVFTVFSGGETVSGKFMVKR